MAALALAGALAALLPPGSALADPAAPDAPGFSLVGLSCVEGTVHATPEAAAGITAAGGLLGGMSCSTGAQPAAAAAPAGVITCFYLSYTPSRANRDGISFISGSSESQCDAPVASHAVASSMSQVLSIGSSLTRRTTVGLPKTCGIVPTCIAGVVTSCQPNVDCIGLWDTEGSHVTNYPPSNPFVVIYPRCEAFGPLGARCPSQSDPRFFQ